MSEDDKTYPPARNVPQHPPASALQIGPGAVLKDTYRIEAELGHGGMGTVFRATHIGLDKTMAVKVLSPRAISSPDLLARFSREARVAGKVNHPAMTHVIDFGVEQGTPYIVMEYVDGIELAEYIERHGAMPLRQAVAVMRQIVSLLHAAHSLGIVHRDLKPSNIKIVQAGPDDGQLFVKVLDFGIAKVIGDMAGQLTSEGMMVGTPAYMAPEQISGKPIDGRTDLYAAGLICHEMLSGVRAFKGETIARILHAQLNEPPPPLALALPEVVRQTLQKFYEKRPEDRFQDAAQADRALMACEDAVRSLPTSSGVAPMPLQGGVARGVAGAPESLSATMQRPESSGAAQAAAQAVGGFSATMQRPGAAVSAGQPLPSGGTPARPITDREQMPVPLASGGPSGPARPVTDRQPVPTPLSAEQIPSPVPQVPVPGPHPAPVPNAHRAANPRGKSPGSGKGCLIAVLVVGFMGCLGLTGIGFLAWLASMNQNQQHVHDSAYHQDYHDESHSPEDSADDVDEER
ncbi:serine/threonine protein kinase [Hyalangium versicolor]|uniref:serine/threonine protein kinase n=1 Tax=Hyalangium versicolor TaxID=2861190 RepID=UPI001CCCC7AF|nr:serine/threonine-protein kinase [Hyalangium versicolor]